MQSQKGTNFADPGRHMIHRALSGGYFTPKPAYIFLLLSNPITTVCNRRQAGRDSWAAHYCNSVSEPFTEHRSFGQRPKRLQKRLENLRFVVEHANGAH